MHSCCRESRHHPFTEIWIDDVFLHKDTHLSCEGVDINGESVDTVVYKSEVFFALVCDELTTQLFSMGVDVVAQLRQHSDPYIFRAYHKMLMMTVGLDSSVHESILC